MRSSWLILEAQPAFSTKLRQGTSSAASSSRSPAQRQTFFRLKRSQGQGSLGLQMQWPSLIDRPMIRLRFSKSIMADLGPRLADRSARSTIASSSGRMVRKSKSTASLWMREKTAAASEAQRPGQLVGPGEADGNGEALGRDRFDRHRAAPDLGFAVLDVEPDFGGQGFAQAPRRLAPPACPSSSGLKREHPVERMASRSVSPAMRKSLSVASSAAIVSLPQRNARASGFFLIFVRSRLGLPDDEARLRAADELVAAEAGDVRPGPDAGLDQRLGLEPERLEVDQGAAAQVVDDRNAALPAELDQLLDPRLLGEADDPVVAVVDAEDGAGRLADRLPRSRGGASCSSSRLRGGRPRSSS